ncbi:hypothetical protein CSC70_13220 [Pseudoxanthomonas kalamensis DSM 18571]|uniref:hypothetical protein n=1 Tax=Pseudoxanthomonas kalamensis TaxID=289483 RepID=UPI001391B497|nr:hypothetical protein [Pseudoxanthomonas kalamensis]KAF1708316.1 hypothetical protein CSC70_13220 [Pseudoxanthomonas kalamensis DSM 18571]
MLPQLWLAALTLARAATPNNDLPLVCHVQNWSPPAFVASAETARHQLDREDAAWVNEFEQTLAAKSLERDRGSLGISEFDRFASHQLQTAAKARPDLALVLKSVSARYSPSSGADYLIKVDSERMLAQHQAAKAAKHYVGTYIQIRYINGLLTYQEGLSKIIDRAPLGTADDANGLTPSLQANDTTILLSLRPDNQHARQPATTALIDRYTGELLLERMSADGQLLYTLSGECEKRTASKF